MDKYESRCTPSWQTDQDFQLALELCIVKTVVLIVNIDVGFVELWIAVFVVCELSLNLPKCIQMGLLAA